MCVKVDGHGIDSIAKFFLDFGYVQRDELRFPAKKLKALWFSPPQAEHCDAEPLPRVFISELLVDELSPRSQVLTFHCNMIFILLCFYAFNPSLSMIPNSAKN